VEGGGADSGHEEAESIGSGRWGGDGQGGVSHSLALVGE
jgi:hypothetical protein